jgi:hypothetical protein
LTHMITLATTMPACGYRTWPGAARLSMPGWKIMVLSTPG